MEPLMVCKPVVGDSHDFGEKPDPDPHQSEKPRALDNGAVNGL